MKRTFLHILLALSIVQAPTVSYARGGYGGYGGYGGIASRVEIDPAVTQRLRKRMEALGYHGWLELNGVYKPDSSEARIKLVENGVLLKPIKAEVNLDYKAGDANHFEPSENLDAYFAKIVLMAARLLDVEVESVKLSISNIGCHDRFRSGRFVNKGGCGGRFVGEGAPIQGLVNDIQGTIPKNATPQKVALRVEALFRKLGGTTVARVKNGNILVEVKGLKNAVVKGGDRSETVTVYIVRSVDGVSGETSGDGSGTMTVEYTPEYHIILDGGYAAGKSGNAASFEPFEPDHFAELDALGRHVNAVVQGGT